VKSGGGERGLKTIDGTGLACVKSGGGERGLITIDGNGLAAKVKDILTGFGCVRQGRGSSLDRVLEDTSSVKSSESWSKELGALVSVVSDILSQKLAPKLCIYGLPPDDSDVFRQ